MTTESQKLTAAELVGRLKEIHSWFNEDFPTPVDTERMEAIDQAMEAIKALQLIAEMGGTEDEELGIRLNGKWCAEQAKAVFHET